MVEKVTDGENDPPGKLRSIDKNNVTNILKRQDHIHDLDPLTTV